MKPRSARVATFIYRVIKNKLSFTFWLFIRFISAFLPLITIYQFSGVIKLIENHSSLDTIVIAILAILVVRLLDNLLRLKSVSRLEFEISNITFDIHNYLLTSIDNETKEERHAAIQAVRNFADAVSTTLNLIKQPGIDSLVSIVFIPAIILALDFHIFIITVAYILVYCFTDYYTTQRYAHLKNILNNKTEAYYAKLQDSDDFDLEQVSWTRHFNRLVNWTFSEWSYLQNISVIFYILIFLYLVGLTNSGVKELSDVVLIMGYASQTQIFLNSFSSIQDSLTDTFVGLERLASNHSVSAVDLEDLI